MKKTMAIVTLILLSGCVHHSYHAREELMGHLLEGSQLSKYDMSIGVEFVSQVNKEHMKYIGGDLPTEMATWLALYLEENRNFKKVVNINVDKEQEVDVILKGIIKNLVVRDPGISGWSSALGIFYGIAPMIEHYGDDKNIDATATVKFQLIDPGTDRLMWEEAVTETATKDVTLAKISKVAIASLANVVATLVNDWDFASELQRIENKALMARLPTDKEYAVQGNSDVTSYSTIRQRWAVLIGISKYDDKRIPALSYASDDAKSFYDWLVDPGKGQYAPSHVKLLTDEQATYKNIRESLFDWLQQAIEEDLVIIYFSGHGTPPSPDRPDNLFLLCHDTQYDRIITTGFPMWDIETALRRFIKAKKVTIITDACHSGGVGAGFEIARKSLKVLPRVNTIFQKLVSIGDGVAVLNASDDKQLSQEGNKWGGGHGVFTYFLLKGLEGAADYNNDGRSTLGELIPYVSEQVRRETKNAQCPTVAGRFDPALSIAP